MTFADIGLISHATATFAFLLLLALIALSWQRGTVGATLVVACAATVVWGASASYAFWVQTEHVTGLHVLEILRTAGWMIFIATVLSFNRRSGGLSSHWKVIAGAIAAVSVAVIAVDVAGYNGARMLPLKNTPDFSLFGRLFLSVGGLLLVENLFRNTAPESRWGIKLLCIGAGGLFAYDFFMYSDAVLFSRVSNDFYAARGVTNALIVPLIALSVRRNPAWSIDVFVSRQAVFHSASLIGAGLYLLLMAGVGFYLRQFGGEWGTILQTAFLFSAIILLALIMFSGSFRARLKDIISRNFFSHKYDYRDEWVRFIATFSDTHGDISLTRRVMQGIANIVESPQGAIWSTEGEERFVLADAWNMTVPQGTQEADGSFLRFLEEEQAVINLQELSSNEDAYPDVAVPSWLRAIQRGWLIVPLLHHERLHGFLLLGEPRAPRTVDREDYVLLTTVGRQGASYLAERASAKALAEAQQFEEFNRRFAFVLHDIKNLVSQLSLLVQNAEKHKDNPRFQKDMLDTVEESVEKMKSLLVRLHESGKEVAVNAIVVLEPLLRKVVHANAVREPKLTFEATVKGVAIVADEQRLRAVMAHLIDNALEATANGGQVVVRLDARGAEAIIEVQDTGIGMDEEFVRNELFRPFRTTKAGGYGIGAYESREFVRELGGRMEVRSAPGQGTSIRIRFPAVRGTDDADDRLRGMEVQ